MHLNLTSKLKVMNIWISRELPLFNFERLDILCAWIWPPCDRLWPFEFLESFRCSILSVSIYYAPESDIRVKSYEYLHFTRASVVQFRASRYIMSLSLTSEWKVTTIWNSRELPLFNFELLYMWCPKSVIRVKSYDHLNFSTAFFIQFWTSWYIMRLTRTSEWNVMTIWNAQELPLFNFERLDL